MKEVEIEFLKLLSYLFVSNGQAAKGVIALEALQVVTPNDAWCSQCLAYAYVLKQDYGLALRQSDRHIETFGNDRAIAIIRGRAMWGLGKHDEARKAVAPFVGKLRG